MQDNPRGGSLKDKSENQIIYHIDPKLTQKEIDDAYSVNWIVFPDCEKCNPTSFVLQIGSETS